MSDGDSSYTLTDKVTLLERAISYLLGSLRFVAETDLGRRTPCRLWDVAALLVHLDDSLSALGDAGDSGYVELDPASPGSDGPVDLVSAVRSRATDTLGAWMGEPRPDLAVIGGCPVSAGLVIAAGTLEVAVHGWDLATACGRRWPIPQPLAEELLAIAPALISAADRPDRFAHPRPVRAPAGSAERLIAFLGRTSAPAPAPAQRSDV